MVSGKHLQFLQALRTDKCGAGVEGEHLQCLQGQRKEEKAWEEAEVGGVGGSMCEQVWGEVSVNPPAALPATWSACYS